MPSDNLIFYMLRELAGEPTTTQRGLAQRLGVSVGRVNYCMKALVAKGWIKAGNFRRSDSKWAYAYVLTPAGAEAKLQLTVRFLQEKADEYNRLRQELDALEREVALLKRHGDPPSAARSK